MSGGFRGNEGRGVAGSNRWEQDTSRGIRARGGGEGRGGGLTARLPISNKGQAEALAWVLGLTAPTCCGPARQPAAPTPCHALPTPAPPRLPTFYRFRSCFMIATPPHPSSPRLTPCTPQPGEWLGPLRVPPQLLLLRQRRGKPGAACVLGWGGACVSTCARAHVLCVRMRTCACVCVGCCGSTWGRYLVRAGCVLRRAHTSAPNSPSSRAYPTHPSLSCTLNPPPPNLQPPPLPLLTWSSPAPPPASARRFVPAWSASAPPTTTAQSCWRTSPGSSAAVAVAAAAAAAARGAATACRPRRGWGWRWRRRRRAAPCGPRRARCRCVCVCVCVCGCGSGAVVERARQGGVCGGWGQVLVGGRPWEERRGRRAVGGGTEARGGLGPGRAGMDWA